MAGAQLVKDVHTLVFSAAVLGAPDGPTRTPLEDVVVRTNILAKETKRLFELYIKTCAAAGVPLATHVAVDLYYWCLQLVQAHNNVGCVTGKHALPFLGTGLGPRAIRALELGGTGRGGENGLRSSRR